MTKKSNTYSQTIGKLTNHFFSMDRKDVDLKSFNRFDLYQNKNTKHLLNLGAETFLIFNHITLQFEYISPNFSQIIGVDTPDLAEKCRDGLTHLMIPEHLEIYNKEILPEMFRMYRNYAMMGKLKDIKFSFTFKIQRPDGKVIWTLHHMSIIETFMIAVPHLSVLFVSDINEFKNDEVLNFTVFKKAADGQFKPVNSKRYYGLGKKEDFGKKEMIVLHLLGSGLNTKEIANELSISPETVYNHRKSLLKKTGASNVHHLIQMASIDGLY
jgi:DNA-binding CsgD family transcriptional regulator